MHNSSPTFSSLVVERFQKRPRKGGHLRLNRAGAWETTSWSEFGKQAAFLAAGMRLLGLHPGHSVTVIGAGGQECLVGTLACVFLGVPVEFCTEEQAQTLTPSHLSAPFIMTGSRAVVSAALGLAGQRERFPRRIIGWGGASSVPSVLPFGQICLKGADALSRDPLTLFRTPPASHPEDWLFGFPLTEPEGRGSTQLRLSQDNCLFASRALSRSLALTAEDRVLDLLPAESFLERTLCSAAVLYRGATEISVETQGVPLLDVLRGSSPTVVVANGPILDGIMREIEREFLLGPALGRSLSAWALRVGIELSRRRLSGVPIAPWLVAGGYLADRIALSRIRSAFGDRVRTILIWPGTVQRATRWFLEAAELNPLGLFGCPESSGIGLMEPLFGARPGSYGRPMDGVEIALDPEGRLRSSGPHVVVASESPHRPGFSWVELGLSAELDDDGYFWPERPFGALDAPSMAMLPISGSRSDPPPERDRSRPYL